MQQHVATPTVDPRAADILERVKGVFAAKGFDGASMQDLARAAGISAGNFYRYFPSKGAIIEAMVQHDLSEVEADFARIMQDAAPRAAMRATIWRRLSEDKDDDGPLWAEIEAAAARRPEIAAIQMQFLDAIRRYMLRVFALIAGTTADEAARRFGVQVDVLMLLLRGAAMDQCGQAGGSDSRTAPALRAALMRHVDLVLAEVAGDTTFPLHPSE